MVSDCFCTTCFLFHFTPPLHLLISFSLDPQGFFLTFALLILSSILLWRSESVTGWELTCQPGSIHHNDHKNFS